ncbi:MAG: HPr family phosphocarrier protein [Minwuia sp.]|uniref:HPr family phosphocarrier protein n=1 Tax=Minwuia sp. TaxID=2493630 RepID=UPI003A83DC6A
MNAGGEPVVRETLTICNEKGLHARAAAKFVSCAAAWRSDITVEKGGVAVGGDSIMGLMMLAAAKGCTIEVTAVGSDATDAVAALKTLVDGRFDEER